MADEAVTLRDINWRETFPFTHLFRAFRIAIHPSKLVIALVALGCLWCGGLVLDAIWPDKYQVTAGEQDQLWVVVNTPGLRQMTPEAYRAALQVADERRAILEAAYGQAHVPMAASEHNRGIFRTFFDYEVMQADNLLMFRGWPFESTWRFVAVGPVWLWSHHPLFALIYTAWFLLLWAVLGGAIARIAAVHVARDEKISVRHSLTFSAGKVLSFVFAPVIPVFIIFGIGIVISLVATVLLHIPYVGPIVTGLFFFLALIGGFVITLLILGTLGGFNLMYPTIAVEGSDSFDAISRSFSYVFARPWRMLWYTAVAVTYGAICYLFVRFFVWLMLAATWFFMAWLLGGHHAAPLDKSPADVWPRIWTAPADPLAEMRYSPDYDTLKGTEAAAAGLIVWWVYIVIGLVGAFAISFYFSANTIIYYLMRRVVDATDLDDVYVEETEDQPEETEPSGAPANVEAVVATTTVVRATETPTPPPEPPNEGAGA